MKDLNSFRAKIIDRFKRPLPGLPAQLRLAPAIRKSELERFRIPENAKKSAVLILLYPDENGLFFPLIERAAYDGVHSRQIGLPGGAMDPGDADEQATALREAQEEVGIDPGATEIIGSLSELYIPPSNFRVKPFVGISYEKPAFQPDPVEVASLIEAPLSFFMDPGSPGDKEIHRSSGERWKVPGFELGGHIIWGATAMILSELVAMLEPEDSAKI